MGNLFRTGGGDKELVSILLGEQSFNQRSGTATLRWDIKNKTDKWRELTSNNFYPYLVHMKFVAAGGGSASNQAWKYFSMGSKSYDANNGILTVNFNIDFDFFTISGLTVRCNCYLVM